MAETQVLWAPATDPGAIQGQLPVTSVTYTDVLNGPGAISGTMPLDPIIGRPGILDADTFGEGRTALWVLRDGVPMWAGLMWGWSIDMASDTVTFDGEGWLSWLRRRRIDDTIVYINADQAVIAADLVVYSGGPIVVNDLADTDTNRDRTYYRWEGKHIGEALEQLAAVDGGFDLRFDPIDTGAGLEVHFEARFPASGRPADHTWEVGANCNLVSLTSDGKRLANYVRAFGSGEGADAMVADAVNVPAFATSLRLDETIAYGDIIRQQTLADHATRDLRRSSTPIRLAQVQAWPDTLPGLGDYSVGDHAVLTVRRGFIAIDRAPHRITSRSVTVSPDGGEVAVIGLAPLGMFFD